MNPVDSLLEKARQLESDQRANALGDETIVPRCIEMIEAIRLHQGFRSEFAEAFRLMWSSPEYGWEPIMFCMRVLRWPEIEEFIRDIHIKAVADHDHRAEVCARGILEAYEDDWPDGSDGPYQPLEALRQSISEQASDGDASQRPC